MVQRLECPECAQDADKGRDGRGASGFDSCHGALGEAGLVGNLGLRQVSLQTLARHACPDFSEHALVTACR